ncbi:hypothetical protein LPJ66_005030, partial [Kickxella alabastrina]
MAIKEAGEPEAGEPESGSGSKGTIEKMYPATIAKHNNHFVAAKKIIIWIKLQTEYPSGSETYFSYLQFAGMLKTNVKNKTPSSEYNYGITFDESSSQTAGMVAYIIKWILAISEKLMSLGQQIDLEVAVDALTMLSPMQLSIQ